MSKKNNDLFLLSNGVITFNELAEEYTYTEQSLPLDEKDKFLNDERTEKSFWSRIFRARK